MNLPLILLQLPVTQATTILSIVLLALFILAFTSSGSQRAFLSLDSKDINLIKTKPNTSYKRIVDLLEKPQELLFTMQVATLFFYLGIAITANLLINYIIPDPPIVYGLMIIIKAVGLILFIFLFCECLPKSYAAQENIRFAKDFGVITEFIYYIFRRAASWMLLSSSKLEITLFKRGKGSINNMDIDHVINKVKTDDASEEAKKILKGVLNFNKIPVKQIMRSRLDIVGVEYGLAFPDVLRRIKEVFFSKLPVYKNNMDEAVGVLYVRDLLPHINDKNFNWHDVVRPAYFVHEYKMIEELLNEFSEKGKMMAIVVDEFGGTSGIVTMEDIHAAVIGEIKGEYDTEENPFEKINDFTFIFNGKVKINDSCKIMGLPLGTFDVVKGDSDSIAGLVLEIAGEIPNVGERIHSGDFIFEVVEVAQNRLQKVKIIIDIQD